MELRPEFIVLALFLNILGGILKYRTPVSNELLPLILFLVACIASTIWGYGLVLGTGRALRAFVMYGIVHGTVVTAIAVYGWDLIYGLYRYGIKKKEGA